MHSLALIHYRDNDIVQAYKYMKSAIEDVFFCKVRFRYIELSSVYSIINAAYLEKEVKQKSLFQLYLVLVSVLSFFLAIAVLYVYKQMRRISKIQKVLYATNQKLTDLNQIISHSNDELSKINMRLEESNQIKEEYISQFFDLCSTYINKMEDYRKMLNRKALNNEHKELFNLLKSNTLVEDELKQLYETFDIIFLNLYPTFIEDFYSLIVSEEQTLPKQEKILNTELRIFALIRLGITDSVKIAGFLRYSLSTIYNYRTKMRNKAIGSRDKFEEMVMKIGNFKNKK
jgi:DNA gyrase/topoisomerase IV subunit A